ncbi:hypothetical protein ASD11_01915 [Aeromicrobium sp. Root495]|nr:hypothetical protein ASD11_01915 [Aeromicrobium sp. Root495]
MGAGTVSVQEHLRRILDATRRLPSERVPLRAAAGRTLAADLRAVLAVPAFDNSAMDGFAVRWADVAQASGDSPVVLDVVGDLPAGSEHDPALGPGQAVRIMTGSVVPTQADTVVPLEDTREGLVDGQAHVTVLTAPRHEGRHVRRLGEDVAVGDPLLRAGTRLGPRHVAAALSAGHTEVEVVRTPRLAVFSTGSELVDDGSPLGRGQIPESNGAMIAQLAAEAGVEVVHTGVVPDDDGHLVEVLREVRHDTDVVVLTGGVSAGAYDVVKSALGSTGEMGFWTVRMQPGKPQGFGVTADGRLLVGLPGNPVGAAVSWEVFVRPALLTMQGRSDAHRRVVRLPVTDGWPSSEGRTQYVAVELDTSDPGQWRVRPVSVGCSGSHLVASLARADGYAVLPEETTQVEAGDLVDVLLVD